MRCSLMRFALREHILLSKFLFTCSKVDKIVRDTFERLVANIRLVSLLAAFNSSVNANPTE